MKNIRKREDYKFFAEDDIDRVVHFTAESHVDRSIKNLDKIKDEIGWEPETMFKEGIKRQL